MDESGSLVCDKNRDEEMIKGWKDDKQKRAEVSAIADANKQKA